LAFHIHDVRQAVAVPMLRVESIGDVIRHYEIHNPPFVVKHSWRTADLAEQIGRYLGMDRSQLELTRLSALLHDWKYPFDFCSDPSFTDEQYQLFKLHPWAGFTAQIEAAKATGDPRLVSSAYGAALHHARRQGISYPQVPGDAIPVIFGAVGAADVFDALRNPRPNHDPFHPEHVYDIFRNGDRRTDPREFDPRVYQAMMANFWDLIKRHDQLKKPGMMQ